VPFPFGAAPAFRTVFDQPFDAMTIAALEAKLGTPLEETLEPFVADFDPNKFYRKNAPPMFAAMNVTLEEIRLETKSLVPIAAARADEAVLVPSDTLLRDLRALRAHHDEANGQVDATTLHELRADIWRRYREGMSSIRRLAATTMARELFSAYHVRLEAPQVKKATANLVTATGVGASEAEDFIRAAADAHVLRAMVTSFEGKQLEAIVERHRPACAIYVTFK